MTASVQTKFYYHLASREDWGEDVEDGQLDDSIVDDRDAIEIEFVYPLRNPVRRTFTRAGGFTRRTLAETLADGYAAIYDEEEKSRTASPEPKGLLLNRSETDGVHGIWGHDIGDLSLEGAYRDDSGVWHPVVGS